MWLSDLSLLARYLGGYPIDDLLFLLEGASPLLDTLEVPFPLPELETGNDSKE